jgi:hypothetical protein
VLKPFINIVQQLFAVTYELSITGNTIKPYGNAPSVESHSLTSLTKAKAGFFEAAAKVLAAKVLTAKVLEGLNGIILTLSTVYSRI